MIREYRRHVGARVCVEHKAGTSIGTLWSVTPRTVWLLVDRANPDEFIYTTDVITMDVAT